MRNTRLYHEEPFDTFHENRDIESLARLCMEEAWQELTIFQDEIWSTVRDWMIEHGAWIEDVDLEERIICRIETMLNV